MPVVFEIEKEVKFFPVVRCTDSKRHIKNSMVPALYFVLVTVSSKAFVVSLFTMHLSVCKLPLKNCRSPCLKF